MCCSPTSGRRACSPCNGFPDKRAASVRIRLSDWLATLPKPLRRTLTFDNGTKFALHYKLRCKLSHGTFFCDQHTPWQEGGIENAIGRMR
jgi:IS30 family transposase